MSEPFIGEIKPVGFNFAPRGWAFCDGQILPINQNTALFSLLGTTYGGDGRTTFGLPDLRGRSILHVGQGPGLQPITWGERGGRESVTLTVNEMPSHTHTATLHGETAIADRVGANGRMLAQNVNAPMYADVIPAPDKTMAPESIRVQNSGNNQAFDNRNPFLGIYVCIALVGIFPSRN